MASTSGRTRSRRCASPSSSTCVPIRSSGPTDRHGLLPSGESTVRSCSCRRRSTSAQYISTFKEFPPSQKVGSFSLDQVLDSLTAAQNQREVT